MPVARIEEVLEDLRQGRMIILVDDEDRENEGDLTMAAEKVTPEAINFMARYGRGLICLSLAPEIVDRLKLPLMVKDNRSPFKTAFTVSIEARQGVTTGISAADRAHTILTAVADDAKPEDLVQPGHVFPLRARRGGVLFRTGQTEGSVDLARLAGLEARGGHLRGHERRRDHGPNAGSGEVRRATRPEDRHRAGHHRLPHEERELSSTRRPRPILPTPFGEFTVIAFVNDLDEYEHLALVKGEIDPQGEILVRVHSQCTTGDVFGSFRCDCGTQLQRAMEMVQEEGQGVILYMQQEGRGIGLANKIKAYALQDKGRDTVEANEELGFEADLRDYGVGAQILAALGVRKMRLMTNNPKKIIGLEGYGLEIVGRVPIETEPRPENLKYLVTKCQKLGHLLKIPGRRAVIQSQFSRGGVTLCRRCWKGKIGAAGFRFAIVVSRFNDFISSRLVEGAMDALRRHGAADEQIILVKVPGAFEIPLVAKRLAKSGRYDAVICLGAVIRGATPHFDYVAAEVSKGIATVALETRVPVTFGVLTTDNLEQAIERAGSKSGNKGWDAAMAAMEMVNLFKQL